MFNVSENHNESLSLGLKNLNKITTGTHLQGIYMPINALTGKGYNGINRILLANSLLDNGYKSNVWGTYLQAKQLGFEVNSIEKPTKIIYWTECENSGELTAEYTNLYNITQLTACRDCEELSSSNISVSDSSDILKMLGRADVTINHTSLASCYQRKTDTVFIGSSGQFESSNHYHGEWVKQLVHSTKHGKRLNRDYIKCTASLQEAVACEEMVAFIGIRFLCDAVGCQIPSDVSSNIYKNCWEQILRSNPKLLLKVCADAQRAVEYMLRSWVKGDVVGVDKSYSLPIGLTCSITEPS